MKDDLRENINDLKKMLFLAEKMTKPTVPDTHEAANAIYALFMSFVYAGFERKEALELVKTILSMGVNQ